VMGLILGALVEESFSQSMIIYDNNFLRLFESPIVLLFFFLTAVSLLWPMVPALRARFGSARKARA
jgi:putative tricarboxylic transport membrane protein